MPRSRMLRMLGGAVAAAAVPALRARPALGRSGRPSLSTACPHQCPDPRFPFVCSCPGPKSGTCFIGGCGPPGSICCCTPASGGYCPPGYRCGGQGESNCVCSGPRCGGGCCKENEECCGGAQCCKPNEECLSGRSGPIPIGVCVPRCPQGRARCGAGKCCPPNWRCADPARKLCKRCKATEEECGRKCCDKRTTRCCGEEVCCRKGRACCTIEGKRTCCPPNTKCADRILPGATGPTPGSGKVCCPKDRHVPTEGICCPPGKTALTGPGLQVGAGLEAFCCANDQVCRSGASITCCQKSAVLGSQTCCNGKCVDIRFDASNCGTCGNVCASGVCSGGICALP